MLRKIKYQLQKRLNIKSGYMIFVGIMSIFLVIGGFSFAIFSSQAERRGALNIVTGNLYSLIESEDLDKGNSIIINSGETKTLTVNLKNVNAIDAKFNFYYEANEGVSVIYDRSGQIPPGKAGYNIRKDEVKTYKLIIKNESSSNQKILFGSNVGLLNKTLEFPADKRIVEEAGESAYLKIFNKTNLGSKGALDTSDSEQTFITGDDPNNYVWYSGKLWRAVSKNTSDNTVKLVTQWDIATISYNAAGQSAFKGSYMESWLNDTSVDGFLGNLRNPEDFIKMDSKWNATQITKDERGKKPAKTTMVTDAVGLLNAYEYAMSYTGTTYETCYLNNGLYWYTLTPNNETDVASIQRQGWMRLDSYSSIIIYGIRPAVNLKASIEIVDGNGSRENPYRLKNDHDELADETLLTTRYSGEYVQFGTGENNLYRIVSYENGKTKIVSAEPLKSGGSYITKQLNTTSITTYNPNEASSEVAYFLNNDFLNPENGYLTTEQVEMIEKSAWYQGTVARGENYKLAKFSNITSNTLTNQVEAKVGLLRYGELMAGQYDTSDKNISSWLLSIETSPGMHLNAAYGNGAGNTPDITNRLIWCSTSCKLKSKCQNYRGRWNKTKSFYTFTIKHQIEK